MAPLPSEPQKFVLISSAYTDGLTLRKNGPSVTREFGTECSYGDERSFRTAATFVPKQVPRHYITTLTVSDELTYYECIAFERRTVAREYSETTNVFLPKETKSKYISSLYYDPDSTTKCYVVGTELMPAQKFIVVAEDEAESAGDAIKSEINGDIIANDCKKLMNGVTEITEVEAC